MSKTVTGQVERTPGGAYPYAVFFKLHGVIIGEVGVHEIAAGEAIIDGALEYLGRIGQEAGDEEAPVTSHSP